MLEICTYHKSERSMAERTAKHVPANSEQFEFNLERATGLCCMKAEKTTACGQCETCHLNKKLKEVKEWFHRLGDFSKKKFMLGLLRRIHSTDLLGQLVLILQPVMTKDFTYARTRSQPSLLTDAVTLSADRAMAGEDVLQYILSTWDWFMKSSYWSKANFTFSLLQACDAHLLYLLYMQANTLLVSEQKAKEILPGPSWDNTETESSVNAEYSYNLEQSPELQTFSRTRTDDGQFHVDLFTGSGSSAAFYGHTSKVHTDAASVTSSSSTYADSVDPAIMIIPTSSKAYSGVSRYKDFIGTLPVHLAKCILSYLDQPSLFNALCVNSKWRSLVEEVHQEHFVTQSLWEEVMLMQGAAAQGANPVYASDIDVLVPAFKLGTHEVLETEDMVIKTTFKSEINFKTAYSGIVTRKVIMEERNVYCGAYNVMVLCDIEDNHRVIHTDGGSLIALGSRDRKVRFIDCESGKDRGPVITGHAGSIRCIYLWEKKGLVFSGSYDTSIRCWSIETGQCLKIFRGHTDTVMIVLMHDSILASGAKDKSCKLWDIETGKCKHTFRHHHPVLAVALSSEICITGCEGGRVKVWELSTGQLIKSLSGHHGPVTAIKFDQWHIVTGSRDGYALAWSALGHHNRCLTALRHPKEVLCLEFMYLRVITGSADGRLRIWNMISGQCCRIMRGNSRSDPILNILAVGDRITLNTHNNLLVLNFEHVDWDYTLETDKMPPLVQYGSYSDAPVRVQPYSYVRAQRMRKAGASNSKLLHQPESQSQQELVGTKVKVQHHYHAPQLPHSAKSLSEKNLDTAKRIQNPERYNSARTISREGVNIPLNEIHQGQIRDPAKDTSSSASLTKKPPAALSSTSHRGDRLRSSTTRSGPTVTIIEKKGGDDDSDLMKEPPVVRRRVSWAFDKPLNSKNKTIDLSEMKALLRSQIRMQAENIIPPEFIYLTVNTIQATMVPSETNRNTRINMRDEKVATYTKNVRPFSSPSRIDSRTKVPVEELGLEMFRDDEGTTSEVSDLKSIKSVKVKETPKPPPIPSKEIFHTQCASIPLVNYVHNSLHPNHVKTTIPRGRIIRPISAGLMQEHSSEMEFITASSAAKLTRPETAPVSKIRPGTSHSRFSISMRTSSVRPHTQQLSSTSVETSHVPMLMYSKEMLSRIEAIKHQRKTREPPLVSCSGERPQGRVSPHNTPLRTHIKFELKTHEQEQEQYSLIKHINQRQNKKEHEQSERKRRAAWLAKAKGEKVDIFKQKPSSAP